MNRSLLSPIDENTKEQSASLAVPAQAPALELLVTLSY